VWVWVPHDGKGQLTVAAPRDGEGEAVVTSASTRARQMDSLASFHVWVQGMWVLMVVNDQYKPSI